MIGADFLVLSLENCATQAIRRSDPKVYDELMDAIFKFSQ